MKKYFKPVIITESESLCIRKFLPEDADAVFLYRSLEEVARYQYWQPYTKEQASDFVNQCKDSDMATEGGWNGFAIVYKESGQLIGDCAVKITGHAAEIGCNISPVYQKQGFAREAMRLVIDMCFNLRGVKVVCGITDSENAASVGLMQAIGMSKTTDFVNRIMCKGVWCIEHEYSIKKAE
ncbi:N-acetyltransferase [Paludibacter sp. 221]|uniref:GNAT family N-acetyltransferase n=1 Tax=Paludibacter sp. 221 TaxID=2302939 RepID=UPI0013D23129|nr:GNAT family N-acetyltransferase [Paludibacter sp. 221]NDV47207.1 N-acetyltransferase [Paludibacter sp. 221]